MKAQVITHDKKALIKAFENFRNMYPNTTSADLQTFILGWTAAQQHFSQLL